MTSEHLAYTVSELEELPLLQMQVLRTGYLSVMDVGGQRLQKMAM